MTRQRLDTSQAAQALGISRDAVRKRVSRGLLESDKDPNGKLFVWLDIDTPGSGNDTPRDTPRPSDPDRDTLIDELRSHNAYLREIIRTRDEEARRKDHIILALSQRIPELEPAREGAPAPRESPLSAEQQESNGDAREDYSGPQRRSWWSRLFAGE